MRIEQLAEHRQRHAEGCTRLVDDAGSHDVTLSVQLHSLACPALPPAAGTGPLSKGGAGSEPLQAAVLTAAAARSVRFNRQVAQLSRSTAMPAQHAVTVDETAADASGDRDVTDAVPVAGGAEGELSQSSCVSVVRHAYRLAEQGTELSGQVDVGQGRNVVGAADAAAARVKIGRAHV